MRSGTAPAPTSRTDDVSALAALASVAAAAFCPTIVGASPGAAGGRRFRRPRHRDRHRQSVAQRRSRALAQPDDADGHAVHRHHLAASAGASAVGRRRHPRRLFPLRGIRAGGQGPRLDVGGLRLRPGRAPARSRKARWPGDIRGADLDRVGGGIVDEMPVEPFRTDPDRVWIRKSAGNRLERSSGARVARRRPDPAGVDPASPTNWCSAPRAARWCRNVSPAPTPRRPTPTRGCRIRSTPSCVPRASRTTSRCWAGRWSARSRPPRKSRKLLDGWIKQYVRSNAPYESRARYPLIAGKVTVHELPGKPGSFGCMVRCSRTIRSTTSRRRSNS